jgi:pimeloyl-ACP methyl ester carboxylesterase
VARRRKPAHLVLIHGRGRFSFDRPPPELFAARWVGRLEEQLREYDDGGLSEHLSGVTFLDYMSLLAPYSRAYRRRLEADLEAVAARMADESREETETVVEVQAEEVDAPGPRSETRYCPDCTGRYAESPFGAPRRRLRHLGRRITEPFGVERVAWVFPDAVAYLANERLRSDIHDMLAYRLPPKRTPVIVVAHSLGTVVAADLWAELGDRYRTRLFLTAGSPLAVPLVRRRLHPRTAEWTQNLPDDLPWVNVIDPVDPVTLARELRPPYFDSRIANLEVENGRRFHSEDRYLSHIAVAREVVAAAR